MSAELEQLKNDMKRLKITEAAAVVDEKLLELYTNYAKIQANYLEVNWHGNTYQKTKGAN